MCCDCDVLGTKKAEGRGALLCSGGAPGEAGRAVLPGAAHGEGPVLQKVRRASLGGEEDLTETCSLAERARGKS